MTACFLNGPICVFAPSDTFVNGAVRETRRRRSWLVSLPWDEGGLHAGAEVGSGCDPFTELSLCEVSAHRGKKIFPGRCWETGKSCLSVFFLVCWKVGQHDMELFPIHDLNDFCYWSRHHVTSQISNTSADATVLGEEANKSDQTVRLGTDSCFKIISQFLHI